MTKVAVVGSRTFDDYRRLCRTLDRLRAEVGEIVILSGDCPPRRNGPPGADLLAKRYAAQCGLPYRGYPALWRATGKYDAAAGPRRNTIMATEAEVVVAFWDGRSHGTGDMINKARRLGRRVIVEPFDSEVLP